MSANQKIRPLTCENSCELLDTESLRDWLEQKLEKEGLSMSIECAHLINNGLDCYLMRLIERCMKFVGSSRRSYTQRPPDSKCASLIDFFVAMESNPRILGGDWEIQLEKICSRAFEE